MTDRNRQNCALCGLFLLAVIAVFAVQSMIVDGARVLMQYLPSAAVGAAAALLLYFGRLLPESLIDGAAFYGVVSSALVSVWGLMSGNQTAPFWRFDRLGIGALFAQSEFGITEGAPAFAPFAGPLTALLFGGTVALSIVTVARFLRKKGGIRLLPNAASLLFLVLPVLWGFAEYLLVYWRYIIQQNFLQSNTISIHMILWPPILYLVFGVLTGALAVKGCAEASRLAAAAVLVLSLFAWFAVFFWGFVFPKEGFLTMVGVVSTDTSGVFLGFAAGAALRVVCAPKKARRESPAGYR